jgi:hypothetical protein
VCDVTRVVINKISSLLSTSHEEKEKKKHDNNRKTTHKCGKARRSLS